MDKRVLKTKRVIRKAFMTLLADKDLEKISVKEVAAFAEVDRKTVYNYYKGVNEILEEIENELTASFERATEEYLSDLSEPRNAYVALVHFIKENYEICNLLLRCSSNTRLVNKTVGILREKIRGILQKHPLVDAEKIELAAEYVTAGTFAAYRSWFLSENRKSLEEFSEELAVLSLCGLPAYLLKV